MFLLQDNKIAPLQGLSILSYLSFCHLSLLSGSLSGKENTSTVFLKEEILIERSIVSIGGARS